MWIYLNNSFLSIVAHNDKPEHMHVRGRRRGDIEAVFPEANVTDTPDRDYAFRADISKSTVEEAMLRAVRNIKYGNFKGSISETSRHDEYLEVWGVMVDHQNRRYHRSGPDQYL